MTNGGRETNLSFEPGFVAGGREPSTKPDRLTDLKLPDNSTSQEKTERDGTKKET
jgi:hypothetical protein|tara:strand:+ start:575 stop:739 length:165 start_codon:yes stop_codon:yes gene_type:complete